MLNAKTQTGNFQIDFYNKEKSKGIINEIPFDWDVVRINENSFHIIKNNKSYFAEIVKKNNETKTFTVKINGNKYEIKIENRYDSLLKEMGFDVSATAKIKDVKAPMPGLVLDIAVTPGQAVKSGDTLLVLEAMKMENIIKSPTNGTIKNINIKKRDAVEKNAVLITFA